MKMRPRQIVRNLAGARQIGSADATTGRRQRAAGMPARESNERSAGGVMGVKWTGQLRMQPLCKQAHEGTKS